ncbi:MAG TPA: hypothetical protein VEH79_01295 [Gaiellaceae bacterium]|nr:hypothetical protein [Gaiellaceae bacterium]
MNTKLTTVVAALAGALLLPALATATPTPLVAPAIPGVAGLPGPIAPAAQPAATMGILTTTPDSGVAGTKFTLSGSGLPANTNITITWSSANVTWIVDPRPDSVDYLGRQTTKLNVLLAQETTDASGSFSVNLVAPKDWGGIHDIYADANGFQLAHGGFLVARSATISPKSGPIGTPITITYSGLGSSLYEGGAALLYDNHFVGAMTANWTRGVAVAHIRASGPVGHHVISLDNAVNFGYLNVQQSPLPWTTEFQLPFTVTKDNGPPKASMDWPVAVASTLNAKTTLQLTSVDSSSTAAATLSSSSGTVNTKVDVNASGLTPSVPVDMEWSTVVGNRVNCSGTCWSFVSVPLGNAAAGADGSLASSITVPDGLGGWHVVQLLQNGKVVAQVPYYVKRSIFSVPRLVVKEGQVFQVHLKGLGWTQLDNTIAVDYDNSYVGYGCGFNSNGDVVLNLVATGGPGTHIIDGYPLLYTQQPSYANTPYGMQPFLTYAQDEPALALGYQLPAIRLAITVVK